MQKILKMAGKQRDPSILKSIWGKIIKMVGKQRDQAYYNLYAENIKNGGKT